MIVAYRLGLDAMPTSTEERSDEGARDRIPAPSRLDSLCDLCCRSPWRY